jgi:predicted nucleic acid-binding protein
MTAVFADTYYWLALINPRDQAHQYALALSQCLNQSLLTTTWVLTEVGDAMSNPVNRSTFMQLLEDIANGPQTEVIPADQALFDKGIALFGARLDKEWSLTDCISIVVMQDRGLWKH